MSDSEEREIEELTETEQARRRAATAAHRDWMGAVESGAGPDECRAAGTAFMQALSRREPDDLNKIHVPDDAGIHRDGLMWIMTRIPDGWGRWISCSRGWYPLICRLDADLSALDSGYVVKQCKEKFGTLKYYYRPSRDGVAEQMNELIRAAYAESAVTCELCGEPGTLHRSRIGWATTLCANCALASDRGYRPADENRAGADPGSAGHREGDHARLHTHGT